jgi:hypothetical protein
MSDAATPSEVPVDRLQLSSAHLRLIYRSGIYTVGSLWARFVADPDLTSLGVPNRKQAAQIRAVLFAFRNALSETLPGELDAFPDPRPLLVDCADECPNLLAVLPALAEAVSTTYDSPREYEILRRRYGFSGSAVYTLEEIGLYYGLTRERVRQIEDRAKRRLADVLRVDDPGAPYRFPDGVRREFGDAQVMLRSGFPLVRESAVAQRLAVRYGCNLSGHERAAIPLLMELWSATAVTPANVNLRDAVGTVWAWNTSLKLKHVASVVKAVRTHLEKVAHPESLFHLTVVANRSSKERVGPEDVQLAISLLDEVEEVAPEEFRWRFEHLSSLGDKAYAVLLDAGEPLHFTEIARRVNQRMTAAGFPPAVMLHQSLGSQLSMDDRFESVGRSGNWKLKTWDHVRTDSIVDLMREALAARQEPLSYDQIHAYVVQYRPEVPRQSLPSLVALTPDVFARRSGGLVELVGWGKSGVSEADPRRTREMVRQQIREAVLGIVNNSGSEPIPLARLVREIRARTELPENTVRIRLKKANWAEITNHGTFRTVTIDIPALEQEVASPPQARIRTDLENLVNEYLDGRPDRRASIREIWKHVRRLRPRLKRPTLYAVLSRLPGLRKERVETQVFYARDDA